MRRGSATVVVLALWACGSDEPGQAGVTVEDVIEGLALGTGPVGMGFCPVTGQGVWTTWERGASVSVVVGADVPAAVYAHLAQVTADLNQAMGSYATLSIQQSTAPSPNTGLNRIVVAELEESDLRAICPTGDSCVETTGLDGRIRTARIVHTPGSPNRSWTQDLGRTAGLCRLSSNALPDAIMAEPVLNPDRAFFTSMELEAMTQVFQSGIDSGADRDEFVSAGLLN